jgi:hypothetical protein
VIIVKNLFLTTQPVIAHNITVKKTARIMFCDKLLDDLICVPLLRVGLD